MASDNLPDKFPPSVIRRLGYYVYVYIDPRDNHIFYVGKARGNRVFEHLRDERNSQMARMIKAIRSRGLTPRIDILVHGIKDEVTALRVESAVIDLLGVDTLTNSVRGWFSGIQGRMGLKEVVSLYERQEAPTIEEPSILIRINKLYRFGMSPVELYDATRGVWKIGNKKKRVKYALAVYEGIVREVYQIEGWFRGGTTLYATREPKDVSDKKRWEFVGSVAPERIRNRYLNKSVERYIARNAQNPIRYVSVK